MSIPNSIDSNVTGLAIAEEASLKTLPGTPIWLGMEPNSYSDFGATFNTVARETINATRQRLKGTITDESAKGGFSIDFTQRNITKLLQGFFWADAIEKTATQPFNGAQVAFTSVSTTQYLAATGLAGFLVHSLVSAKGFAASANNGLKEITVVAAGALTVAGGGLVVDASPAAAALLETVGYRAVAGDLHIAISGSKVLLTSTALDFTTFNLTVGEWVFLGGDAAINNFVTASTANNINQGYARIFAIAAHTLTFDITTFTPNTDADGGGLQRVDLYFGKVLINAKTSGTVKRRTYQLERQLGNDGVGVQSEYVTGAVPNELTLNLAQANKVTADLSYVGLDVEQRDGTTGIKSGTRIGLLGEAAFNTTQDVYLSRLAINDPTVLNPASLFAFASDIKITINNGANPNKAIGVLGGFDVSSGDFAVSGTLTAYFQTVAAILAIKNNADIGLQTIFARANAGMVFDMPRLTLGGGGVKIEKDKPITVDLTQDAAKSDAGFTLLAGFFEYLPTVAMP
jgi:hypothetical protein